MVGLSVVSQTLCKIVVFPAFALPMTRTRNLMFGIGWDCFVSIAFVSIGERQSQESIQNVLVHRFTRLSSSLLSDLPFTNFTNLTAIPHDMIMVIFPHFLIQDHLG